VRGWLPRELTATARNASEPDIEAAGLKVRCGASPAFAPEQRVASPGGVSNFLAPSGSPVGISALGWDLPLLAVAGVGPVDIGYGT